MTKICINCKIEKSIIEYSKDKQRKDKLNIYCKICKSEKNKKEYQRNKLTKNAYYLKNKEKINKYRRDYGKKNRKILNNYNKIKYSIDINHKLGMILRTKLGKVIKNGSTVKDLGCSINELKVYLEEQFKPGMSWNNYNKETWHIDHIIPLCRFNLSNREEFLKACHYTNLQPLWAKDNLTKGKKYDI